MSTTIPDERAAAIPAAPHTGPVTLINVATWASVAQVQAAHQTEQFRQLVGQPAWKEFPSSPAIYEVVTEFAAQA